jgi:hypothetical protein
MVTMEKLVKRRLAGETEVLGENLPQRHFVQHKSHMTRPRFEPGPPLCGEVTMDHSDATVSKGTGDYYVCSLVIHMGRAVAVIFHLSTSKVQV